MGQIAASNLHSRLVAWLKVLLPLTALAIMSTLFLVSRTIDPNNAIPYADVDVADRIRQPRMTAPTYAGMTADGASIAVTAAEVRPDAGKASSGTAKSVHADLATPDGATTVIVAQTGQIDSAARLLRLQGKVQITTSSGYVVDTEALTSNLDQTRVVSESAVTATGPMGRITAGQMLLTAAPAAAGAYVLVFKNRVKLIYTPAK